MGELARESYSDVRAARGYSHVVYDSGFRLHLVPLYRSRELGGDGRTICGRSVDNWNEKSAECWAHSDVLCVLCEGPLGPKAVLKP